MPFSGPLSLAALSAPLTSSRRGVALGREGQVDQADVGGRHAHRRAVELALELRKHLADGAGGAGGGRDHRHARGARAAHVGVDLVEDLLVVGVGVDGGHQPALDADRVVQHLGDRRQAVGGAAGVGDDRVLGGQLVVVDAIDDGQVAPLAGAEISTRLAPASRCFSPPSLSVKKPVHSSASSTPLLACGSLAGSRSAVTGCACR
jgi:hypothetical protein